MRKTKNKKNTCLENKQFSDNKIEFSNFAIINAVVKQDFNAVKHLIDHKADVNVHVLGSKKTALHIAVELGNEKIFHMLLAAKANIHATSNNGFTALHVAAQTGQTMLIQHLIMAKANMNAYTMEAGTTPLMEAAAHGHHTAVLSLLKMKANPYIRDRRYLLFAVDLAQLNHHFDISKQLAQIMRTESQLFDEDVLQVVLQDIKMHSPREDKFLTCAQKILFDSVFYGFLKVAQTTIEFGAKVNTLCGDEFTIANRQSLLFIAAHRGDTAMVNLLLQNNAHVNESIIDGSTPLLVACQNGHEKIVNQLLEYKADIHHQDNDGEGPIYIAAAHGMKKILPILLAHHAEIDTLNRNRKVTTLFIACQNGHLEIVKFLITQGAKINSAREDGTSPLHIATSNGHQTIIEFLLDQKADMYAQDGQGFTPLHYAITKNDNTIIDLFLHRMTHQQQFIQSILYVLLKYKDKDSDQGRFVETLLQEITNKNNADEVFLIIQTALKSAATQLFQKKSNWNLLRSQLITKMKQYNADKNYSKTVVESLTNLGLMPIKKNKKINQINLVLDYCAMPIPRSVL